MIDTDAIFRYKIPNAAKLAQHGFADEGASFSGTLPLGDGQFVLRVRIAKEGAVSFAVIEKETNEEYRLINSPAAQGGFVGSLREACEKALSEIAHTCFDTAILKAEQTKRLLSFVKASYNVEPEYLWAKSPDYDVLRRGDSGKWFAIVLTVPRIKLGLAGGGSVELLDLKATPEKVTALLGSGRYLPAYHMNKQHWLSAPLDGSLPDDELFSLIDESYLLAKK